MNHHDRTITICYQYLGLMIGLFRIDDHLVQRVEGITAGINLRHGRKIYRTLNPNRSPPLIGEHGIKENRW